MSDDKVLVVEDDQVKESDTGKRTIDLYDTNEGKVPRTGGPYRDVLEREEAEKWRAKAEDREPDYDNPPATAATQLVPKDYLRENDTDKSHFSDKVEVEVEPVDSYEYEEPKPVADPAQVDWGNDMSQVTAMEAKARFEKAKEEAGVEDTATPEDAPDPGKPLPSQSPEYTEPKEDETKSDEPWDTEPDETKQP